MNSADIPPPDGADPVRRLRPDRTPGQHTAPADHPDRPGATTSSRPARPAPTALRGRSRTDAHDRLLAAVAALPVLAGVAVAALDGLSGANSIPLGLTSSFLLVIWASALVGGPLLARTGNSVQHSDQPSADPGSASPDSAHRAAFRLVNGLVLPVLVLLAAANGFVDTFSVTPAGWLTATAGAALTSEMLPTAVAIWRRSGRAS